MPTLFRLLTTIAVLVALAYGAMFVLATFVRPNTKEIRVPIPEERFVTPEETDE